MKEEEVPVSEEVLQHVRSAQTVRPARVRAARERISSGDWPSPTQVADALLDGWFLRLVVHA